MRIISAIILIIVIFQFSNSQYLVPDWVRKCPAARYTNYYFCGNGVHKDIGIAREIAFTRALKKMESDYVLISRTDIDKNPKKDNSNVQITMKGENKIRNVRVVDSYSYESQRGYHVWKLISIPKPEHKQKPLPSDWGAFARAAVFPGWGHFYKERYERGMLFIGIEIVAGIVAVSLWNDANKNSDFKQRAINVSILTAALHLLNIIDATTIRPDIQWY